MNNLQILSLYLYFNKGNDFTDLVSYSEKILPAFCL